MDTARIGDEVLITCLQTIITDNLGDHLETVETTADHDHDNNIILLTDDKHETVADILEYHNSDKLMQDQ